MTTIDLRRLRLRPGEVRTREARCRARAVRARRPALRAEPRGHSRRSRRSHRRRARRCSTCGSMPISRGPCMRCLGFAEVEADVARASSTTPTRPPRTRSRSDYVVDDRLDVERLGARRGRSRAPRADPVPAGLRRPLPGLRKGPERRAARAPRPRGRSRAGRRSRSCARSSDRWSRSGGGRWPSPGTRRSDACRSNLDEAVPGDAGECGIPGTVGLHEELHVTLPLQRKSSPSGMSRDVIQPSSAVSSRLPVVTLGVERRNTRASRTT